MKTRMRLVRHTGGAPVFDRIVMNIVAVAFKIMVITNLVFPITALPNRLFPFMPEGKRALDFECSGATRGEMGFDQHPAG